MLAGDVQLRRTAKRKGNNAKCGMIKMGTKVAKQWNKRYGEQGQRQSHPVVYLRKHSDLTPDVLGACGMDTFHVSPLYGMFRIIE